MDNTEALELAIEKANKQMRERGSENWSIADNRTYREELARLTGEPMEYKPWDKEMCGERLAALAGHTFFNGKCVQCGRERRK
jgi:hypothetical protein